jgi:hypothetical protein
MSRESRALALVAAAALAVAIAAARPWAGAWNDGSRLATVESLVDHGTLAIDDSIFVAVPPERTPYQGIALANGTLDKLLIDGRYYSDKSPVPGLLLAAVYQLLQWLTGLSARLHPAAFCYLMTLASSGAAYVCAVVCVFRLGRPLGLTLPWRLALTASFALATVAVVYTQHVNNHVLLLGVAAVLTLQLADLTVAAPAWRLALIGSLAGLGYAIDLGAGPPLLIAACLAAAWQDGRWLWSAALFTLGALPWLALHHAVNYAVGGTLAPANAVPAYFDWPGCPFHGTAMTGSWHHQSVLDFAVYALAMLFGKRGFFGHNLPLFLLLPGAWWLLRHRPRETPLLAFAALWAVGTWLLYAANSRNYSGMNLTIRWFVPLLAPAFAALAVLLRDRPASRAPFLVLSAGGLVLAIGAWSPGPWSDRMVPLFWPVQAAALLGWAWLSRRRLKPAVDPGGYTDMSPRVIAERRPARPPGAPACAEVLEGDPA